MNRLNQFTQSHLMGLSSNAPSGPDFLRLGPSTAIISCRLRCKL
jgi:hypothetical protein